MYIEICISVLEIPQSVDNMHRESVSWETHTRKLGFSVFLLSDGEGAVPLTKFAALKLSLCSGFLSNCLWVLSPVYDSSWEMPDSVGAH